jgi:uncharacterized protein YecT (DUF1311 family)
MRPMRRAGGLRVRVFELALHRVALTAGMALAACNGAGHETVDAGRGATEAPSAATPSASAPPPVASAAASTSSSAPTAPPPDDKKLGFPSSADCADAKKTLAGPETNQMEMSLHAAAKATLASCSMQAAFVTLRRSIAPGAASGLDATQTAWRAFFDEREHERFPHAAEPGYYGSILNTCYGELDEATATARTAELQALAKGCSDPPSAAAPATQAAKTADAALNEAYGKIRKGYAADATFLKALTQAQVAWLKYRDAQVALAAARSEDNAGCAQRELARVTGARVDQLRVWLKPATDGDACGGSYGMP